MSQRNLPLTINIKHYVTIIHSAYFLPPLSVSPPKKAGIHPRSCLCQEAVITLIPPMDQTSDLKRGLQDKALSLECSGWGFWQKDLGEIEVILYLIWRTTGGRQEGERAQNKLDC